MVIPIKYKPKRNYPYTDFIVEIPNAISSTEATRLKQLAMSIKMHTMGAKSHGVSAVFDTCMITDENDSIYPLLEKVWIEFLQSTQNELVFIEPYELKRYNVGSHFGTHIDSYINLKEKLIRKFTMVVQLSDSTEYEGGDLVIGEYTCSRVLGTAVLFHASMPHKVTEVTKNNRFSLIGHGWGPY